MLLFQEALSAAGPAHEPALDAAMGVFVGCMYTEYLDGVLAKQVHLGSRGSWSLRQTITCAVAEEL